MGSTFTRRQALGLGAALLGGAAVGGIGIALPTRSGPTAPVGPPPGPWPSAGSATTPTEVFRPQPVSMAMHLHASFSEGVASMDAHLQQAEETGVDVVWWTEHDFRVQAHGYRQAVRFDGPVEPEGGLDWTWVPSEVGPVSGASGTFVEQPRSPDEPGRALRLRATGPAEEWGWLVYEGQAWNSTYSTSLADTVLELDVLTESVGADAELVVELRSSHRPATAGRLAGQYALQYRVGSGGSNGTEADGRLGVVRVVGTNRWQRLRLRPVDDIAALWPELVAGDASLHRLRICVRARRGATVSAVVDRLRFVRERRADQDGLALQAELMAAYAKRYPGVRQHQAGELSLVRHLNRFGGKAFLPDYGSGPPYKDDSVEAAMAMVARVHEHGGITSYNHPPAGNPKALGRELVETRNLGAELLEVGCGRSIDSTSYAYDIAARNAVFVTATGVTDDHEGTGWLGRDPRWVTHAWAASTGAPELVDALAAGRCWLADPAGWRGAMGIELAGEPAMGGVLVTPQRVVPYEVVVTDLPSDAVVELVTGVADLAGAADWQPRNTVERIPAGEVRQGTIPVDVRPGPGAYLRVVVRDGAGAVVGFSNPTWVLPVEPPAGIPPNRRIDQG